MSTEWVRAFCLSLPGVTEHVQWEDHLVFKVGGKSFAITSFEPRGNFLSLKVSAENFRDLPEREGIIPAPYLARAQWLAIEREDAAPRTEVKELLREAYEIVVRKLPKKVQTRLAETGDTTGRG